MQALNLHLNPGAEIYDPSSTDAEHYIKYNSFLAELVKHGYMPSAQAQEEMRDNQARSQLLSTSSLNGIDPAIIAKWRPSYYISNFGRGIASGAGHTHVVVLHWAAPGSDRTVEWYLSDNSGNFGPGVRSIWPNGR